MKIPQSSLFVKCSAAQIYFTGMFYITNSYTLENNIFFSQYVLWTFMVDSSGRIFFFISIQFWILNQTNREWYSFMCRLLTCLSITRCSLYKHEETEIIFSNNLEYECYVSGGLDPILPHITPCFLWNPLWSILVNTLRINLLPMIISFIHLTLCSWFCFFSPSFSLSLYFPC